MKKRTVFLLVLMSILLSACVYFTFPSSSKKQTEPTTEPTQTPEEMIEAYFNSRPVRDVPDTAAFGEYLAGTVAKQNQDFKVAASYLKTALDKDPDHPDLKDSVYLLYVLAGDVPHALPMARLAMEQNPSEFFPRLVLFTDLAKQEKWQEAKEIINIQANGFGTFLTPMLTAWIEVGQGNEKAALKALEPLLKEKSLKPLYLLHKGLILEKLGQVKGAAEAYDALLAIPEGRSIRSLLLVRHFEEQTGALENKLQFVTFYQNYQEESFVSKEAMMTKTVTDHVQTASDGIALALFDISGSIGQVGGLETALFLAQLSLYLTPDSSITKFYTGEVLEKLGRKAEANALYATVKQGDDIYYSLQMRTVMNLINEEKTDEAILKLKQMIKMRPYPIFYMTLGDAYRQAQQYEKALQAYQTAFEKVQETDTGLSVLYFSMGLCEEKLGHWNKAEAYYQKAVELDAENPIYSNYLGYTWLEMNKNLPEAMALIEKAVEQFPQDGNILDSLGWGYFLQGEYEKALPILEKAVDMEAGNAVINAHLGDLYWRLGRFREARFQWQHALQLKDSQTPKLTTELNERIQNGLPPAP